MKAYYVTETTNRQNLQDMIYIVYVVVLLLTFCSCQQEGGQEGLEFDCTTSNVEDWEMHTNAFSVVVGWCIGIIEGKYSILMQRTEGFLAR